jgi:hypothetical protein
MTSEILHIEAKLSLSKRNPKGIYCHFLFADLTMPKALRKVYDSLGVTDRLF